MRNYIYNNVKTVLVIFLIVLILFASEHIKYESRIVTILNHSITSDKYGEPKYNTIVMYRNGNMKSLVGLEYYMRPVGETMIIDELVWR